MSAKESSRAAAVEDAMLVRRLRSRLQHALAELAACRARLAKHGLAEEGYPASGEDSFGLGEGLFSHAPEDHEDVLGSSAESDDLAEEKQLQPQPQVLQKPGPAEQERGPDQQQQQQSEQEHGQPREQERMQQQREQQHKLEQKHQEEQEQQQEASATSDLPEAPAPAAAHVATASTAAPAALELAERDRARLEEDLSMAKALLMLNNVHLNMDFGADEGTEGRPVQAVSLKGNRQLIQMLITLKQKVALLNQQYLLLRGDMLYLSHEMNVCRHWVLQSFRMAMQQSQEHSSQTRFERRSKVN